MKLRNLFKRFRPEAGPEAAFPEQGQVTEPYEKDDVGPERRVSPPAVKEAPREQRQCTRLRRELQGEQDSLRQLVVRHSAIIDPIQRAASTRQLKQTRFRIQVLRRRIARQCGPV